MSELIIMVGLPRSGKTTYCNEVLKPQGYVIVNPDNFRLAIHGQRFVGTAEPFIWACIGATVNALRLSGHDVVLDGCFLTRKRRDPWNLYKPIWHPMGVTKEVCIQRAQAMGDEEIIEVIERMASDCDWPDAVGKI